MPKVVKTIKSVPGVLAVTVDYEAAQATIGTAVGSEVPKQKILAALASMKYTGVFIEKEEQTQNRRDAATFSFHHEEMLQRFDADLNGKLDESEKRAIRRRFGNIDVPMLPKTLMDFTTLHLPANVDRDTLDAADSTPADNPITNAGATLGRVLFYDKKLSANNTVACASCHLQRSGFSDPRQLSVGFDGVRTGRNTMNLANLRFSNIQGHKPGFFWDERAATLEEQVLMPIQDPIEMGMKLGQLEQQLAKLPYYPRLFEAAFGSSQVTSDRIAKALAQFVRAMVSMDARFDRAAVESDDYSLPFATFTKQENLGKSLFIDGVGGIAEHGCAHCHVPPTFGMTKAQNNGLAMKYKDQGLGALNQPKNDPFTPSNDGKFKAPSLRNIELTAPYMHDGRFATLEEVINHYSDSVHLHKNLTLAFAGLESASSPSGLKLTNKQKAALVAFLKTLTDPRFVTDPRFSDPFIRLRQATVADTQQESKSTSASRAYQALLSESKKADSPRDVVGKFFDFARKNSKEPAAVDALAWIATHLGYRSEAGRAVDLLQQDHLTSRRLVKVIGPIAKTFTPATQRLLNEVLTKSPHTDVKAQACFHLVALLDGQLRIADELKQNPSLKKRAAQYYGKEMTDHLVSLSAEKVKTRKEQLCEMLLKSFAQEPAPDGTMGEFAKKTLFALRHLSVGSLAPDITGDDVDGRKFKLSDYRGKVVMLSFWGHW